MRTSNVKQDVADDFINFVNSCCSSYHAVAAVKALLDKAGFTQLQPFDVWQLEAPGKYYVIKDETSIYAFAIGGKYTKGAPAAVIVGQTDNDGIVLKPMNAINQTYYYEVGVALYGTSLWHTWFDRDLSVAGRVFLRENGKFIPKLVAIKRALLNIPDLAIHFDSSLNSNFKFNTETNFIPIIGSNKGQQHDTENGVLQNITNKENIPPFQINRSGKHRENGKSGDTPPCKWFVVDDMGSLIGYLDKNLNFVRQDAKLTAQDAQKKLRSDGYETASLLNKALAEELGVNEDAIAAYDLNLIDIQPATQCGVFNEFIVGSRLKSITSCYCPIKALIQATERTDFSSDDHLQVVILFDYVQTSRRNSAGPGTNYMKYFFEKIAGPENLMKTAEKSCIVNAEASFAVHPNYSSLYEEKFRPALDGGPVITYSPRVRNSSNAFSAAIANGIALELGMKLQKFMAPNSNLFPASMAPLVSSNLGIPAIDIGVPLLGNDSIRSTVSGESVESTVQFFKGFLQSYNTVRKSLV